MITPRFNINVETLASKVVWADSSNTAKQVLSRSPLRLLASYFKVMMSSHLLFLMGRLGFLFNSFVTSMEARRRTGQTGHAGQMGWTFSSLAIVHKNECFL